MGSKVTNRLYELTDFDENEKGEKGDIQTITEIYDAYIAGTLKDIKGLCAVVDKADIKKHDYILTPGRYVGHNENEIEEKPYNEMMEELSSDLSELFKQSASLQEDIKNNLCELGFKI